MTVSRQDKDNCEFFEWIGAAGCDRCGRPQHEHKGVRTLRDGAGPFGSDQWEDLTWDEYDARAKRDRKVRLLKERIATLGPDALANIADVLGIEAD